jgi:lipid-binding SYLF domain-containing protein
MKSYTTSLLASLVVFALCPVLHAESKVPDKLVSAVKTIEDEKDRLSVEAALVDLAEAPQLEAFFKKSHACAIFPTIGKGGLGIGGAHGSGWVFEKNKLTGTSKMSQLTFGLQAGGQAFSQIIFFENEQSYKNFIAGNFELGAQASAVALHAGANASASTGGGAAAGAGDSQGKSGYTDGMAIFTKAKGGLMYEASVGGQKFKFTSLKEETDAKEKEKQEEAAKEKK